MQNILSSAHIPTPCFYKFDDEATLAYIVNLGMLGEGIVKGAWVPFPTTEDKIASALKGIGIDKARYKNFFVAQYVTNIDGLESILPPCPDLNELNFLATIITLMDFEEMETFVFCK